MTINTIAKSVPQPIEVDQEQGLRLFQFDSRTGGIVEGRRMPWQSRDYYVVAGATGTTHPNAAHHPALEVPIQIDLGKAGRRHCSLCIAFTAWCLPKNRQNLAVWHRTTINGKAVTFLSEVLEEVLRSNAQELMDRAIPRGMDVMAVFETEMQAKLVAACPHLDYKVDLKIAGVDFSTLPPDPDPHTPLHAKVKFEDYGGEVLIRTKLLRLKLDNPLRFLLGKRGTDLKAWSAWCMQEAAEVACTGAKYADFVSNWNRFKDHIRQKVDELAGEIGYKVVTLLNEPDTPEYNALRELSIALEDAEFKTKDATLPARLSIYVSGHLESLDREPVKTAVLTNSSIKGSIEKRIFADVQKVMHETPANTFYLDFHVGRNGGPSVEEKLKHVLAGVLEEFGVVGAEAKTDQSKSAGATVSIKLGESKVQLLLTDLISHPLVIDDFEVTTVGSGEVTKYNFTIRIDGIHVPESGEERSYLALAALAGADTVANARAIIVKAVRDHLASFMNLLDEKQARYETAQEFHEMQRAVGQLVAVFLAGEYALRSHLRNFGRQATDDEVLKRQTANSNRRNAHESYEKMMTNLSEARREKIAALLTVANDATRDDKERAGALKEAEALAQDEKANIGLPSKRGGRRQSISQTLLGGPAPKPALGAGDEKTSE